MAQLYDRSLMLSIAIQSAPFSLTLQIVGQISSVIWSLGPWLVIEVLVGAVIELPALPCAKFPFVPSVNSGQALSLSKDEP